MITQSREEKEDKGEAQQSRAPKAAALINRAMKNGIKDLDKRLESILRNFQYVGGFSSREEAKAWLTVDVPPSVLDELRKYAHLLQEPQRSAVLDKIGRDAYNFRYNRQMALRDACTIGKKAIAQAIVKGVGPLVDLSAYDAYGRTWYEVQRGAGVGFSLTEIPVKRLHIMSEHALSFTRAQGYAKAMVDAAYDVVYKGILTGESVQKMGKEISGVTDTAVWRSKALARTVMTEVANDTSMQAYKDAGVDRYQFNAELGDRTCPICGRLDGKTFRVDEKQKGKNYPPMHVNCRCSTTAALTKEDKETMIRRARDQNGKYIIVPASMTYEQWAEKYMPSKKVMKL